MHAKRSCLPGAGAGAAGWLGILVATGCSWNSPLMNPAPAASLTAAPPSDRARVVFLHGGANEPHGVGTVRVVDEKGNVLGDSLPDTWFAVDVAPGEHRFFGWQTYWNGRYPTVPDGCSCFLHECWWVAAARAELVAGRTYYLWVQTTKTYGANGEASSFDEQIDFVRVSPKIEEWPRTRREGLRPVARNATSATEIDGHVAKPDAYRATFVCIGEARIRRGTYWDAELSDLHPTDGS